MQTSVEDMVLAATGASANLPSGLGCLSRAADAVENSQRGDVLVPFTFGQSLGRNLGPLSRVERGEHRVPLWRGVHGRPVDAIGAGEGMLVDFRASDHHYLVLALGPGQDARDRQRVRNAVGDGDAVGLERGIARDDDVRLRAACGMRSSVPLSQ